MLTEGLLVRLGGFVVWVIGHFPIVLLPSVDLTLVYQLVDAVDGILPMGALMGAVLLSQGLWGLRLVWLVVRWLLWLVALIRG